MGTGISESFSYLRVSQSCGFMGKKKLLTCIIYKDKTLSVPLLRLHIYHGETHDHMTRHSTDPKTPTAHSRYISIHDYSPWFIIIRLLYSRET